jgi:hypothetical protein
MGTHRFSQYFHVPLLNVATVFPQMGCNAIRPGQFGQHSGGDRVWLHRLAGLANGGYVIDVDPQC